jgi:catechol 2,3-dioxygenase-like lactoylglutathione lyase family enzyme
MTFRSIIPRLPVRDLQRTLAFYCGPIGFDIDILWPDDNPTFAIVKHGDVSIGFFIGDEHRPATIGYAELYIAVQDASALANTLRQHVRIEWGPEVYSYGRREFAIRDPDSYLLIFTEETDDAPTTPEP